VKELAVSETRYNHLSPTDSKSATQSDERFDDSDDVAFDEFASSHRRSIRRRERQSRADTIEPEV
jgi:hypothetical protein